MVKYLILVLIGIGLCGCDSSKLQEITREFKRSCTGTLSSEITLSMYGTYFTMKCSENFGKEKAN